MLCDHVLEITRYALTVNIGKAGRLLSWFQNMF